jgi:IMP dehydrogenase
MDTVTEDAMCHAMNEAGGLGILHRYCSIEDQFELAYGKSYVHAAAIGVTGDYLERAQALFDAGVRTFCLDVAHGDHVYMKQAIEKIKENHGEYCNIMAGNVATLEAFNRLADWGADSIRVGIGGGSICSTRIQTGHGIPTFQSILDCAQSDRDAKIIADGGIRSSGDIVKCLAAGADFVMLGSILAGTDESPGEIFEGQRGKYKIYRGMASKEAQQDWRGRHSSNEGVSTTVPCKGSVVPILKDLDNGIRSGLSYSGAQTLPLLRSKARFIYQTSAGQVESSTHIMRK